ncbi:MAG: metallophosphoesterase [Bacteroidales bacterium]|nr:metallophosphoesterase [Bacteroidales bacterium]
MKIDKIIFWILGMVAVAASCTFEELNNETEGDNIQNGDYVTLRFITSEEADDATRAVWGDPEGKGSLKFQWENVEKDPENTNRLNLVLSDGNSAVASVSSAFSMPGAAQETLTYSGLTVKTREGDSNSADFETVRYYDTKDLVNAKYCFAVAGKVTTIEENDSKHVFHLDMPQTFTQNAGQDPSFLRDYMHMYATADYKQEIGDAASLKFTHIPATIRFIITDARSNAGTLQEVSVNVSDMSVDVASKSAQVALDWTDGSATVSFCEEGYKKVTTTLEQTAAGAQMYTAYTMVLPLSNDNAFKSKVLHFNVKGDNLEYAPFKLDAERLAGANSNEGNIYNWIDGKSYTVKINIGEKGEVTGEITADKNIRITSNVAGTYTLKYIGADGNALADYAEICTLNTAKEVEQFTAEYTDFIAENVAPREAEAIGIFYDGYPLGSVSISNLKPSYSEPLYSFGLLSDVHLNEGHVLESHSDDCFNDFKNALSFFESKQVSLTCICGDISENGATSEFSQYKEIVNGGFTSKPVYTTTGNHDATTGGISEYNWERYTDCPLIFEKTVGDDHFLFLGMSRWKFSSETYRDEYIDWLEDKLEEYRNERCFVFTHMFFPDRAGNMLGIYPEANWLSGNQLIRLSSLCDKYRNSIWFSGHSHWKWSLQKFEDRANIYGSPSSGWCVHVPSCARPIDSNGDINDANNRGVLKNDQSEGALVNVYEDHIEILGLDLKNGKYLPIATYQLDTPLLQVASSTIERSGYIKADYFKSYKGDGHTVRDLDDNYVEITFSEDRSSQGWYVYNDTYTTTATQATVVVEDVIVLDNDGKEIEIPAGVGFYGESDRYFLSSTTTSHVNNHYDDDGSKYWGLQFQVSGSQYIDKGGSLPLTIRLKARMQFYPKGGSATVEPTSFAIYKGDDGDCYATDLGDGRVEVKFTKTAQGFYVKNSTYTPNAQKASILVSNVEIEAKAGTDSAYTLTEIPGYIGFNTSSGYRLRSTESAYVNNDNDSDGTQWSGVQFQTSSSFDPDLLPVVIRMRLGMVFSE